MVKLREVRERRKENRVTDDLPKKKCTPRLK